VLLGSQRWTEKSETSSQKSLAPHAGRPPQEARGARRCRGKSREQRGDGKGLHHAYQAAVRVLLSKVLNTQIWTLVIMGVILTGVFVLVAKVQPENDRRTDEDRYGRSHCSNAQRIRAGFSQGSPETLGCQRGRYQEAERSTDRTVRGTRAEPQRPIRFSNAVCAGTVRRPR